MLLREMFGLFNLCCSINRRLFDVQFSKIEISLVVIFKGFNFIYQQLLPHCTNCNVRNKLLDCALCSGNDAKRIHFADSH